MNTSQAKSWEKSYVSQQQSQQPVVKVRQSGWVTKGEKILYACVGICLLIAAAYIVSYSSTTDSLNRDVQELESEISSQQVTNENLLYQNKELKRPERIIDIARQNGLKIQNAEVKQAHLVRNSQGD